MRIALVVGLVLLGSAPACSDVTQSCPKGSSEAACDFSWSEGAIVTVWSWGRDNPGARRWICISANDKCTEVAGSSQSAHAMWRTPDEIVVDRRAGYPGSGVTARIVRMNREGTILEVLSEGDTFMAPHVSPDGQWLLVSHFSEYGGRNLEVRSLDGFERAATLAFEDRPAVRPGLAAAWSPDSERLAVQVNLLVSGRGARGIGIYSRGGLRLNLIRDQEGHGASRPTDLRPLFWTSDGLFAGGTGAIYRCDPDSAECGVFSTMPRARWALAGAAIGRGRALLLAQDQEADPFEVRGREIYQLDLTTADLRLLYRTPDGAFISDIDWTPDQP